MTQQELDSFFAAVLRVEKEDPLRWQPCLAPIVAEQDYDTWRLHPNNRYYVLLNAVVRVLAPRKVLELGTSAGISALFMLLGLGRDATITTVDIASFKPAVLADLRDERLQVVVGDDLNPQTLESVDLTDLDLLFVDTEHSPRQVQAELDRFGPLFSPRGLAIVDDISLNGEMVGWWEGLACPKISTGPTYHWSGIGLISP